MSDRCAFIEAEKAAHAGQLPVRPSRRVTLGVLRLAAARADPTPKMLADAELTATTRTIHEQSHGVYGSARVHSELVLGLGRGVNLKRVTQRMRRAGIQGISRRRVHGCTRRRPGAVPSDDLVHRQFRPGGPDRLWVGDVTQHPTAPTPSGKRGGLHKRVDQSGRWRLTTVKGNVGCPSSPAMLSCEFTTRNLSS